MPRECSDCQGQGCRERLVDGEVVDVTCPWCKGTGEIVGAA